MKKRKSIITSGNGDRSGIHYLLGMMKDSRTVTLKAVKDISVEELKWQPYPDCNPVGALLLHIYSVNEVLRIKYLKDRALTDEETEKHHANVSLGEHLPKVITDHPLEYYLDKLEASRNRLLSEISELDEAAFYKIKKGYDPENGCNLAWVLYHIVEDEINHKGQIVLLRKLYKREKIIITHQKF